jgi:hypothetical protein
MQGVVFSGHYEEFCCENICSGFGGELAVDSVWRGWRAGCCIGNGICDGEGGGW